MAGKKFVEWYKKSHPKRYTKAMPRPSSVPATGDMNAFKDLKKMREFARKRQERCIKDMDTFEHYIKHKFKKDS